MKMRYVNILNYFHQLQFENMIDCFAMFTSLLLALLSQQESKKINTTLAEGSISPRQRLVDTLYMVE